MVKCKCVSVCVELGSKATFFGLGLLASKKMRPYAKYFIVGGLALSAAPVVAHLVEKGKQKRIELEQQVEEVVLEEEACEEQECADEDQETECTPCECAESACEEEEEIEENEAENPDA